VTSGGFRTPGKPRDMLVELMREICAIGEAMGTPLPDDIVERNLGIVTSLDPDNGTSMQRDVMAGHVSEMDGLVVEVLRMAKRYGVPVPAYEKAAALFRERGWMA
jgi:2-dehydropantoate 2-reductase